MTTKDNVTHRPCVTHHHACDCRETKFAQQQALLEECARVLERLRYNQFSMTIEDKATVDALTPRLRGDHG